jgi:glycosyltransferase involved in cell wall biosynthesis
VRLWVTFAGARMRILFANHTSDVSGAEVAMLRLLEGLSPVHDVAVACPAPGPLATALDRAGHSRTPLAEVDLSIRADLIRTPLGIAALVPAGMALRNAARRHRADVIHANTSRAGIVGAVASALGAPPVVVQVHENLPPSLFGRATRVAVGRTAATVVAVTKHTERVFREGTRRPRAKTVSIYISIDHGRFQAGVQPARLRDELGLPPDAMLIGEVANITPSKGQDLAVRTLGRIRDRLPGAHLVIVGHVAFKRSATRYDNERFERELHRLVVDLGLTQHVHFLGHRADVPSILRALDISILPSWTEAFGTVAAESMAVGTPPIATSVGGIGEYLVDGVGGRILSPWAGPDAWAAAAMELLLDPGRRAAMGDAARRAVAGFTDARYAAEMLRVYESALDHGAL